jgi:hypothetical protein
LIQAFALVALQCRLQVALVICLCLLPQGPHLLCRVCRQQLGLLVNLCRRLVLRRKLHLVSVWRQLVLLNQLLRLHLMRLGLLVRLCKQIKIMLFKPLLVLFN